jgi:hypothetical protein
LFVKGIGITEYFVTFLIYKGFLSTAFIHVFEDYLKIKIFLHCLHTKSFSIAFLFCFVFACFFVFGTTV